MWHLQHGERVVGLRNETIVTFSFKKTKTNRRSFEFYFGISFNYPLGKVDYVFGSVGLSVSLFVCLFVYGENYSASYERIGMKFYGGVLASTL